MLAEGTVVELVLLNRSASARIRCPSGVVPSPGQYALAYAAGSSAPLPTVLFPARDESDGFVAAPPVPPAWLPGTQLYLRGPLGHGFSLPPSARRIALVALDRSPVTLLALLSRAAQQDASVALVGSDVPDDLPLQVEAQPVGALLDVCAWADYVAFDVARESLADLKERFKGSRTAFKASAQALVRTPMPCGALAACGICTVEVGGKALLACDDGPVFDFHQLIGWSNRA